MSLQPDKKVLPFPMEAPPIIEPTHYVGEPPTTSPHTLAKQWAEELRYNYKQQDLPAMAELFAACPDDPTMDPAFTIRHDAVAQLALCAGRANQPELILQLTKSAKSAHFPHAEAILQEGVKGILEQKHRSGLATLVWNQELPASMCESLLRETIRRGWNEGLTVLLQAKTQPQPLPNDPNLVQQALLLHNFTAAEQLLLHGALQNHPDELGSLHTWIEQRIPTNLRANWHQKVIESSPLLPPEQAQQVCQNIPSKDPTTTQYLERWLSQCNDAQITQAREEASLETTNFEESVVVEEPVLETLPEITPPAPTDSQPLPTLPNPPPVIVAEGQGTPLTVDPPTPTTVPNPSQPKLPTWVTPLLLETEQPKPNFAPCQSIIAQQKTQMAAKLHQHPDPQSAEYDNYLQEYHMMEMIEAVLTDNAEAVDTAAFHTSPNQLNALPLKLAIARRNPETIGYLLQRGANPLAAGGSPLRIAARLANREIVGILTQNFTGLPITPECADQIQGILDAGRPGVGTHWRQEHETAAQQIYLQQLRSQNRR